jgi:hypothetical protein
VCVYARDTRDTRFAYSHPLAMSDSLAEGTVGAISAVALASVVNPVPLAIDTQETLALEPSPSPFASPTSSTSTSSTHSIVPDTMPSCGRRLHSQATPDTPMSPLALPPAGRGHKASMSIS